MSLSNTARHSAIYALGVLINRAAAFIMLPIYTRYLTPADYGVIELLFMTTEVFAMIASAGLFAAVFRFHAKAGSDDERRRVVSTATLLFIGFYAVGGTLGFALAEPLAAVVLPGVEDGELFLRMIFVSFFLQALIELPLLYIRIRQRPWMFVAIGAIKLSLQLGLNLWFVVQLELHVIGVLYGTLISSLAVGLFALPYTFRHTGIRFDTAIARRLLRFGVPLIIAGLGNFVLTFADRYALSHLAGMHETGLYALGYKLGMVLWVFAVAPLFSAWDAQRFEVAKQPDAADVQRRTFLFFNLAIISFGLALALGSRELFRVLAAPEFLPAHRIVALIALAYVLQMWTQFTEFGLLLHERTVALGMATAAASLAMLAACWLLIPRYGMTGAALSTITAYTVRFAIVHALSQRCYPVALPWGRILIVLALAAATYIAATLVRPDGFAAALGVDIGAFVLFVALLAWSPAVNAEERAQLFRLVAGNRLVQRLTRRPAPA